MIKLLQGQEASTVADWDCEKSDTGVLKVVGYTGDGVSFNSVRFGDVFGSGLPGWLVV